MASVLISGSSKGIGFVTALELARAGHKVIATMRRPEAAPELGEIAAAEKLPIEIRRLDVDSDASVRECFAGLAEPVDVLVNNAGIEAHGSVEEMPVEQMMAVMNTNCFGVVRCMQAVLPQMRERRAGVIVNISSISGRIANSPLAAYCASKFALEAMSEAVAGEVKPYGIRVALVEPGIQDTEMARSIGKGEASRHYPQGARFAELFKHSLMNPVLPEETAKLVREIIESGTWQLRHFPGPNAQPFVEYRKSLSDEEWVDWNAHEDDEWYARVERDFGMKLR